MIYTLSWIEDEAQGIINSWNGKGDTFEYDGDVYPAEQVETAKELWQKIQEVRELMKELSM